MTHNSVRVGRIGLPPTDWQPVVLPLNHTRELNDNSVIEEKNRVLLYDSHTVDLSADTSTRGEMDIMTDFGSVVVGSSPAGCTRVGI